MAIDLSEDTTLEETTPHTEEVINEFNELVQGVEQSTDDPAEEPKEEETEEPKEEETAPEPAPAPFIPEGPTVAAKMAAEQAGIPPQLVELATSDEQLYKFVALARQTSSPPIEEVKLDLPKDEYPDDDPVRKAFTTLQSQLAEVQMQLKNTEKKTSDFEKQQAQIAEFNARQTQEKFDKHLNELGIDALGNTKNLSSGAFHARSAVFNLVQELQATDPGASMESLAEKATKMLYPTNNLTPNAKAAIRKQSNGRLGAGPSQPADPGQRSEEAMMRDFLQAAGLTE